MRKLRIAVTKAVTKRRIKCRNLAFTKVIGRKMGESLLLTRPARFRAPTAGSRNDELTSAHDGHRVKMCAKSNGAIRA